MIIQKPLLIVILNVCFLSAVAQWDTVSPPAQNYPAFYLESHGGDLYAAGNDGIHVSSDNGVTWEDLTQGFNQGSANSNRQIAFADGQIFVRSTMNGVYKSTDNGTNWEMDTVGLPGNESFCMHYDGTNVFISLGWSDYGLYYKTPSGSSWTRVSNNDVGSSSVVVWGITSMDGDLYIITSTGCWESTDGGVTWTQKNSNDLPTTFTPWIQAGNLFKAVDGVLYFGSHDGLYKSSDNGDNWTRIDDGFEETFGGVAISAVEHNGAQLFAATRNSKNAYQSDDNGTTWTDISDSLKGKVTSFSWHNNALFASLFGKDNVYVLGEADTSGSNTIAEYNNPQSVVRAYPNPSQGELTIEFQEDSDARYLTLYDLSGREVLKGDLRRKQSIDLTHLSPGTYTLGILNAQNALISTRKIIIDR